MSMSISRPRLFEIADQPWCPAFIRAHTQAVLTFLWVHRIPPFQSRAPYERAADVLDSLIRHVEEEQGSRSEKGKDKLRVVDCCSGAGGPMPLIERKIKWVYLSHGAIRHGGSGMMLIVSSSAQSALRRDCHRYQYFCPTYTPT